MCNCRVFVVGVHRKILAQFCFPDMSQNNPFYNERAGKEELFMKHNQREEHRKRLVFNGEDNYNARVIRCVEKYPCLYDVNHKYYYRKNKVNEAWSEIACAMNDSERNCRIRWQNIRTVFARHLRFQNEQKEMGNTSGTPYYLSDLLEFLVPHMNKRKRNFADSSMGMSFTEYSFEELPERIECVGESPLPQTFSTKVEALDSENYSFEDVRSGNNDDAFSHISENQSFQTLDVPSECASHHCPRVEGDPDRNFLLGLLPDIQSLTPKNKRVFRMEITKIINDLHNLQMKD